MARGAVRGALVAWLSLVSLEVLTSTGGSGKVAGALGTVNDLIKRAISPDVPLIPDHTKPAASSSPAGSAAAAYGIDANSPTAAAQLAAAQGAAAARGAGAVTAATGSSGLLYNLPSLNANTSGATPPKNAR